VRVEVGTTRERAKSVFHVDPADREPPSRWRMLATFWISAAASMVATRGPAPAWAVGVAAMAARGELQPYPWRGGRRER
jgi:hypothetical protein